MTLETWTNQSTTATNTILKRKWNTIQYNLFTYLHLTSLNSMLFSTYKYNKCTRWFLLCEKSYECNAIFNTFNLFYSFNVRFNLALYVMIQDLFLIVNELPSANNYTMKNLSRLPFLEYVTIKWSVLKFSRILWLMCPRLLIYVMLARTMRVFLSQKQSLYEQRNSTLIWNVITGTP